MKPTPKHPRPMGRLGQLNKRTRLVRRSLGQWKPQEQTVREAVVTRLELAETEWRGE